MRRGGKGFLQMVFRNGETYSEADNMQDLLCKGIHTYGMGSEPPVQDTWKIDKNKTEMVERLKTTADFEHSSTDAREKLLQQLSSLGDSIYMLSSFIEEGYRNDGNAKEPGSVCAEGSL